MSRKKSMLEKDYVNFFRNLPAQCISKDGQKFVFNGVYYNPNGYVEATDGRCAIQIKSDFVYNKLFTDKIVAPISNEIIDGNYPDISQVYDSNYKTSYKKYDFNIPEYIGKLKWDILPHGSIIVSPRANNFNEVICNIEFSDSHIPNNDYLFAIKPEYLYLFAGYKMELYYIGKKKPIIIKNSQWEEKYYDIEFTYIVMPMGLE